VFRGPRKGVFNADTPKPARAGQAPKEGSNAATADKITVISGKGNGVFDATPLDFSQFDDCDLIRNNKTAIYARIFSNRSKSTIKQYTKVLSSISSYTKWYNLHYRKVHSSSLTIDAHFCYSFISHLETLGLDENLRAVRLRVFRRIMEAVGVSGALLPANPYRDASHRGSRRPVLSQPQLKTVLNQAKFEAQIVLRRCKEAEALRAVGWDPRRVAGGKNGDWDRPECRYWIVTNVIGLQIRKFDEMRFNHGLGTELRGLEGRPGAEIIRPDGNVERGVGWKAHLRWFVPWNDDIVPFLALFLLRTGVNLSSAATIQANKWEERFPFHIGVGTEQTHAYIKLTKTRGRRKPTKSSKIIRIPSQKRAWSHPYRVLKFVEELTKPLRIEIKKRIKVLSSQPSLSAKERNELERLYFIQSDLFIFRTEQDVTSLAWATRDGRTPRYITDFFRRCGIKLNSRQLRDAPILFSYAASGQNLFVAQMIANHARVETSSLYTKRQSVLRAIEQQAERIFDLSIQIIKTDNLSARELRRLLREQGLNDEAIANLSDDSNVSRWGNRCADPSHPPETFGPVGPSGVCGPQDCIDGCRYARWFRDSIGHVATELVRAEGRRDSVGLETSTASTVKSRIDRCHSLLSRWPRAEVVAAIESARGQEAASQSAMSAPSGL